MNLKYIPGTEDALLNVIIETPKGSRHKYVYDEPRDIFRLKKTLPQGMVFPFDFGFIPNTLGGDGDPLDVLVIMDAPAYPGILVQARPLGVCRFMQEKPERGMVRNDRIIAVAEQEQLYSNIHHPDDLSETLKAGLERFFLGYITAEGKAIQSLGWGSAAEVMDMLKS